MSNKEQIKEALKKAEESLALAKSLADETGESFSFDIGRASNVSRKIGGDYFGKGVVIDDYVAGDLYQKYVNSFEEGQVLEEGAWSAWQASGEQC